MATPTTQRKRASDTSEASPRRGNRQGEVTRAASEIFYRKGYQATSIQDVADKVGVLKGSLYYYIDSKEDLLWRIIEDVHGQSSEILNDARVLEVTPIERIRIYIMRHVEWYLSNLPTVSVFFREWQNLTGERHQIEREHRRQYERIIRELFAVARDAGDVSPDLDLNYAGRYVLAAVNSVPDWYRPGGADSPAHIAARYADMTIGMLTGTPRPRRRSRARRAA
jgi:AcrR family transcriptional regulator